VKAKRYLWTCGEHPGVLAPSRLRANDVRRFCWPCSLAAGVLVERTAPALARRREAREETRKRAAKRKRATARRGRERQREATDRREAFFAPYKLFLARALRLSAWETDLSTRPPRVIWRISSDGGGAGRGSRSGLNLRLGVSVPGNLELILHELAHAAYDGIRGGFPKVEGEGRFHNSLFRQLLCAAAEEVTGIPCAGGTTGEADGSCQRALREWLDGERCWLRGPFPTPLGGDR
jgi:hypothetical protein